MPCSSDEDALHLMQAAERFDIRVPQDLSVIGFDNSSIAQLERVSLTDLKHVTRTLIMPRIVERGSVRAL